MEGGRIATPLRPSTASTQYEFRSWSGSLTTIRADKTVTAQYRSTTRSYDVRFWDGDTLLATVPTLYDYTGEIPSWPWKEGYFLDNWNPACTSIKGDTDCYAQWLPVISDSWAEILAAEADGTYKEKYPLGHVKLVDMGEEGIIGMQIVGFDKDEMEDGTIAPISWLARNPMKTKKYMGCVRHTATTYSLSRFYQSSTDPSCYQSNNYSGHAVNEFTISCAVATDVTIRAYCSSLAWYDLFSVWVNEDLMADRLGTVEGEQVEQTYHLEPNETLTVFAQYTKYSSSYAGENRAKLWFLSEDDLTVIMTAPTSTRSTPGVEGGYPNTPLREYVNTDVFNMMPDDVKGAIKEVRKFSGLTKTTGMWSLEKVWIPSMVELNQSRNEFKSEGAIYNDMFYQGHSAYLREKGIPRSAFTRTQSSGNIVSYSGGGGWGSSQAPGSSNVWIGFCTLGCCVGLCHSASDGGIHTLHSGVEQLSCVE